MMEAVAVRSKRTRTARAGAPAAAVPDGVLQVVPEIQLESARLGDLSCRACAWVHPTHVTVRTGPRVVQTVQGVRPWRGMALVPCTQDPDALLEAGRFVYEGPVLDGEAIRHVRAEVFFHSVQRPAGAPPDGVAVVEFIGAGTLR